MKALEGTGLYTHCGQRWPESEFPVCWKVLLKIKLLFLLYYVEISHGSRRTGNGSLDQHTANWQVYTYIGGVVFVWQLTFLVAKNPFFATLCLFLFNRSDSEILGYALDTLYNIICNDEEEEQGIDVLLLPGRWNELEFSFIWLFLDYFNTVCLQTSVCMCKKKSQSIDPPPPPIPL